MKQNRLLFLLPVFNDWKSAAALLAKIDACRQDLGDEAAGIEGQNTRPIGRVDHPDTLTHYDPEHPYMIAMYDLKDRG